MSTQKPKPFSGWFPLVELYVAQVAAGAMQCFPQFGAWPWCLSLLMASSAVMWVVFDAQHRGKPVVSIVQLIIMGLWPIAVPIYLLTTRGVRGLGWTILNIVGLAIASCVGYYSTILAVWGPDALWPPV